MLYVVATVVIVYTALLELDKETFNALYWVILFFGATVAAGRSFLREGGQRHYYYYTLAGPLALLFSKAIFNTLLIWLIGLLVWFLMYQFVDDEFALQANLFILAIIIGGIGLGVILTFVSALAARAGGSSTLMAVLSFPLVIPILKLVVDAGKYAIGDAIGDNPLQPLLYCLAVDLLTVAVAILLFPFVWRD